MSSGVGVTDEAVMVYQDLKLKKKYKYIVYTLSSDMKEVGVEKTETDTSYDKFVMGLPKDQCRYCVYDFEYETAEGLRNKLLFVVWAPDNAKTKQKMVYASSKDALRRKLDGIYTEIQCTDLAEVSYDFVLDKVTRMTS